MKAGAALESRYIRAEYYEERGSFVSHVADWVDGEPTLEYCFSLEEDDNADYPWRAGLEKRWIDRDEKHYFEFYPFGRYRDEQAFETDTAEILAQARIKAEAENIDELLAVIDILKQRAVALDFDDESITGFEGLFQHGPEDAYSVCDIGADYRLHHHIERDDEYWALHILPVVDESNQPLGWGLFAVHFPELSSTATTNELEQARHIRVLLLDHCRDKAEAVYVRRGFEYLMRDGERVENPEYSRMNDTEVMALFARHAVWNDELGVYIWQDYRAGDLQEFLNGTRPFICNRNRWTPRQNRLVDQFFEEFPQPIWLEDQLRAALDEQAGIESDV
jgi:hypothetical protein